MVDALDTFAPLSDAEIAAARLASPAPEEPGPRLICPPADAESGAHAAERLYRRKPDAIWRYQCRTAKSPFSPRAGMSQAARRKSAPFHGARARAGLPPHGRTIARFTSWTKCGRAQRPDCDLRG